MEVGQQPPHRWILRFLARTPVIPCIVSMKPSWISSARPNPGRKSELTSSYITLGPRHFSRSFHISLTPINCLWNPALLQLCCCTAAVPSSMRNRPGELRHEGRCRAHYDIGCSTWSRSQTAVVAASIVANQYKKNVGPPKPS